MLPAELDRANGDALALAGGFPVGAVSASIAAPSGEAPSALGPSPRVSSSVVAPALTAGPDLFIWLAVALAALLLPLWRLYRRLTRDDLLGQSTRRAVYESVVETPAGTVGTIARRLGIDRDTAEHHLRVLHEFGAIEARRVGKRMRYFRNGGSLSEAEIHRAIALEHDNARRVLAVLLRAPEARLGDVVRATGLAKSTAKRHLDRLRGFGIVAGVGERA